MVIIWAGFIFTYTGVFIAIVFTAVGIHSKSSTHIKKQNPDRYPQSMLTSLSSDSAFLSRSRLLFLQYGGVWFAFRFYLEARSPRLTKITASFRRLYAHRFRGKCV